MFIISRKSQKGRSARARAHFMPLVLVRAIEFNLTTLIGSSSRRPVAVWWLATRCIASTGVQEPTFSLMPRATLLPAERRYRKRTDSRHLARLLLHPKRLDVAE